jgi:hypothetical protein
MRQAVWRASFTIVAVQLAALSAACEDRKGNMDISKLQGRWVLELVNGRPVSSEREIYFEIEELRISGFDGCNRFGGRLDAPGEVRVSQRACAERGPRLPLDLSDPESHLKTAELTGDKLDLPLPGRGGTARFRRVAR